MSYVKDSLARGERVVYTTNLHWVVFLESMSVIFLGGLIFYFSLKYRQSLGSFATIADYSAIIVLFVGAIKFLMELIRHQSSEFAVTTQRVVIKVGVLQRKSLSMPLSKIESIEIDQSLLGRLFGFGSIHITGTGNAESKFDLLTNPTKFRQKMQLISNSDEDESFEAEERPTRPRATRRRRRRRR